MPLSLDLSGIIDGEVIDSADVTLPFGQTKLFVDGLETAIAGNTSAISAEATARSNADTAIVDGSTALNRLVFAASTAVTIATGAFAATAGTSLYTVDTEAAAASDDLDRITGLATNQIVVLRLDNSGRNVVVKHNAGGTACFINASGADITLDTTNDIWIGICVGSIIIQLNTPYTPFQGREMLNSTLNTLSQLAFPDNTLMTWGSLKRLAVQADIARRNRFIIRASNTTILTEGIAAVTMSGTGGTVIESNQADSTYVSMPTTTSIGTIGGFNSTTFNYVQPRHDPIFDVIVRTGPAITTVRLWVGLMSAAATGADDQASLNICFRYSTTGPDVGWRGVCDDGTTQALTPDTFGALTADTRYHLRARVDSTNSTVYFSIDGGVTEIALATNMPALTTQLGFNCICVALAGSAARTILYSRATVSYN